MNTDKPRAARFRAFTLIELLIVVAIIAILAAIAVPNFLEAQVRAKVSRCKADMRTQATALESYVVDNNHYPVAHLPAGSLETGYSATYFTRNPRIRRVSSLTTPIAYLTSIPVDVFSREQVPVPNPNNYKQEDLRVFLYADKESYAGNIPQALDPAGGNAGAIYRVLWGRQVTSSPWLLRSTGPQGGEDTGLGTSVDKRDVYDPTNGTVSVGNVFYLGGVGVLEGQGGP